MPPEPSPRETTYLVKLPNFEAARLCKEQLLAWGESAVTVRAVERGNASEVRATFAELAPDPAHDVRVAHLLPLVGEYGVRHQARGR